MSVQNGFRTGSSVKFTEDGDTWQFCVPGSCGNSTNFQWVAATFQASDAKPSPRKHFGMSVLDTDANLALLFGGMHDDVGILGDTWLYDNQHGKSCVDLCDKFSYNTASWTKFSSFSPPPKRMFLQIVSLGPGKSIMFGGMNGVKFFDDTWVFSKANDWQQMFPTHVTDVDGASIPGPVGRIQHAMSAPYTDQVMLFGGADQDGIVLDDLWFYNQTVGSQGQWKRMDKVVNGAWPQGRRDHALTWLSSGAIAGSVLLFGGSNEKDNVIGTTWIYQIKSSSNDKVMAWFQVDTDSTSSQNALTSLSLRWGMTLSSFLGSQAVLSGGTDQYNTELSTSLIFTAHNVSSDGNYSGTWTTVTQSGRLNTRMHMNHAIAELGGAKAVLFGGTNGWEGGNEYYPDTWVFDGTNSDTQIHGNGVVPWSRMRMSTAPPPKREDHTLTGVGTNHAIMFGGIFMDQTRDDTWLFTHQTNCADTGGDSHCGKWEEITSSEAQPKGRYFHAAATVPSSNEVVMFGGFGGKNMWGSALWYFTAPSSPDPRVYGNSYNEGFLDDTWVMQCDATPSPRSCSWKEIKIIDAIGDQPSNKPSKRCMHAMASFGNSVILHGGYDGGDVLGDTWVLSRTKEKWLELTNLENSTIRPAGRILHQMTWMGGQKLVLFGGQTSTVTKEVYPKHTWIFYRTESVQDCSEHEPSCFEWTEISSTSSPDPRARYAMFSVDDKQAPSPLYSIFLYGGNIQQIKDSETSTVVANDIWKFHMGEP